MFPQPASTLPPCFQRSAGLSAHYSIQFLELENCMWSQWSRHQVRLLAMVALLVGPGQVKAGWAQRTSDSGFVSGHGRTVEDWSSLSLAGSELVLQKPTFGEKDDLPGFTRELIRVQWRKADPIDLYIIKPKYVPKPPVVLYLYSYPSETDRFRDNEYCARLTSRRSSSGRVRIRSHRPALHHAADEGVVRQ